MQRRKESDRIRIWTALLLLTAMCWTANGQKNRVVSINYEHEIAYYRPRITLAKDGSHAVAWETYKKLYDTEEWQIGVQKFLPKGVADKDVVYLRDPVVCTDEKSEGRQGVQNADIHYSADGQLIVAMEPVVDEYEGTTYKKPRTIISRIDRAGSITSSGSGMPCKTSSRSSLFIEKERPQIDVLPGTDEVLTVGSVSGEFVVLPEETYAMASLIDFASRSSVVRPVRSVPRFYDAWHDVATNGSLAAYSWQRCPVVNDLGDADECDVLIEFVPQGDQAGSSRKTRPIKVNAGDEPGVLNYKPAVAMNEVGESVVVWIDYRYSQNGDILAQRFDATGDPLADNIRVSNGSGVIDDPDGIGPEVSLLNDGRFMVVWTEAGDSGMQAMGKLFGSSGKPEGDAFLLDEDQDMESSQADVASNGSRFAYTWISTGKYGPSIFYRIPGQEPLASVEKPDSRDGYSFSGYPNPFSEETTLKYVLPNEGHVTLIIYDLLGREVKTLIDKWQAPGSYLVNVSAEELAVGYYVTKLQQGDLQFSNVLIRTR